jgi:ribosomal protein S18 acetylase RimI-like enzyme
VRLKARLLNALRQPRVEPALDVAVRVIGWLRPAFLSRDSLKMCWRVQALPPGPPLGAGYELRSLPLGTLPDGWIDTVCASGMQVTQATWDREFRDNAGARVYAVYAGGQIVATAGVRGVKNVPWAAYLSWVAARPDHQGQQLGRHVVTAAMRHVLEHGGYTHLFLVTNDHRVPALSLYLRLGFLACLNSWDATLHYRWVRLGPVLRAPVVYCRDVSHRQAVDMLAD